MANYESSTAGDKVVAQAVKEFGKVDVSCSFSLPPPLSCTF